MKDNEIPHLNMNGYNDRVERGGGFLNQTLPIFWRFDVERLFLQELCIETRPFI